MLILVDRSCSTLWARAVEASGADIFRVIAVAQGISHSESTDRSDDNKFLYGHHHMQEIKQNPFYQVDESTNRDVAAKDGIVEIMERLSSYRLPALTQDNKEVDVEVAVMYDFTGRWMEICSKLHENEVNLSNNNGNSVPTSFCSVVLRPDGHVARIFRFNESSSLEEIEQHMQKIKTSMHMS